MRSNSPSMRAWLGSHSRASSGSKSYSSKISCFNSFRSASCNVAPIDCGRIDKTGFPVAPPCDQSRREASMRLQASHRGRRCEPSSQYSPEGCGSLRHSARPAAGYSRGEYLPGALLTQPTPPVQLPGAREQSMRLLPLQLKHSPPCPRILHSLRRNPRAGTGKPGRSPGSVGASLIPWIRNSAAFSLDDMS